MIFFYYTNELGAAHKRNLESLNYSTTLRLLLNENVCVCIDFRVLPDWVLTLRTRIIVFRKTMRFVMLWKIMSFSVWKFNFWALSVYSSTNHSRKNFEDNGIYFKDDIVNLWTVRSKDHFAPVGILKPNLMFRKLEGKPNIQFYGF